MMPPLPWLSPVAADVAGFAVGLALVGWERRARSAAHAAGGVAVAPPTHR